MGKVFQDRGGRIKFSVVIPSINADTMLFKCIDSFYQFHGQNHEVIVVEDGSQTDLQMRVKNYCEARGVRVILKSANSGFSTTVNIGIRAATGDVIVLVNNDILFTQEILRQMEVGFAKDPKIGVIGALLYYPNQTIQHGGVMRHPYGFTHIGWHKPYHLAPEVHSSKYLISVTGAVYAIRKKTIDHVGLFDEEYFLACEDTQYSLRCWQNGWRVYYDPKVTAIHIEGGTRGASNQDKLIKSLQTRNWFILEGHTSQKFQSWIKGVDLGEIDRRVNEANLDAYRPVERFQEPMFVEPKIQKVLDIKPLTVVDRDSYQIIGIRRTGALGDVMMTTPIIREISKKHPGSKIYFATHCPDALFGNPHISNITSHIEELQRVTNVIYDLDLAYERNSKTHIVDAYAKVVFGHGISDYRIDLMSDSKDFEQVTSILGGAVNFERDKVIVMHMAVSWANRTWPKDYWNTVVKQMATRGYKTIILGRGGDFKADLVAGVINCHDRLNLRQTREIIKRAHVFVGPDSAMIHVAQTTETPCVALFTVASPSFRITRPQATVSLVPTSECRGCLHDAPPPVTFIGCRIGTLQCLREITPAQVVREIDLAMKRQAL